MEVALIWAMAKNRVIGLNNGLPWQLPDDMRHFMATTKGRPVIMGRRTLESMPSALPGRFNIVLTRRPRYRRKGIRIARDLNSALILAKEELESSRHRTAFVIGGAGVYEEALPLADKLFVTWIDAELEGDTWFPHIDWRHWEETDSREHGTDAAHAHPFRFATYQRKRRSGDVPASINNPFD